MPRKYALLKEGVPTPDDVVELARILATSAHAEINQKRKWMVPEQDYIVHPAAVAFQAKKKKMSVVAIAAAWMHDAVEDTNLTAEEIEQVCGTAVAKLVLEVTDMGMSEDGNREERAKINTAHAATASKDGQDIKVIDMMDNLPSIVTYAPDFALIWIAEKERMLKVLTKVDTADIYEAARVLSWGKTQAESFGLNEWLRKRDFFQCRA
jgi:guanosine-3',5'-bis(diphosphate) 3'-pyrophosphohydrolase